MLFLGIRFGKKYAWEKNEPEKHVSLTLTALLGFTAFLVAFIFGNTSSRFESKRFYNLEHVNSIGTTYLRADLIPEPQRKEIKILIGSYLDTYFRIISISEGRNEELKKGENILNDVWKISSAYSFEDRNSEATSLYIDALNKTIDLHTVRVVISFVQKIPETVWILLYMLSGFSMFVAGFQLGVVGGKISIPVILLAFTLSLVISMVSDFERPTEGFFKVKQDAMINLQKTVHQDLEQYK